VLGTIVDRRLSKGFERIARAHLKRQVEDPELRGKLRPNYTLGCKRITLSDTYYPALTQPNAEVVTDPIREITAGSIVSADGGEREVDTIVLRTGFKALDNPGFDRVRGRGGLTMQDAWNGSPRAYLGTTVSGFPNFFLLVGPNSAGGYNSIIFTTEAHVNYAVECVKEMDRRGLRTVEVRPDVYERFNRETEKRLPAFQTLARGRASPGACGRRRAASTPSTTCSRSAPARRSPRGSAPRRARRHPCRRAGTSSAWRQVRASGRGGRG
jgi:cation diffusion facilitator CzcD-associated flavoprotein CzcO